MSFAEHFETRQVERLGYAPEDVRHIVLTHFHWAAVMSARRTTQLI